MYYLHCFMSWVKRCFSIGHNWDRKEWQNFFDVPLRNHSNSMIVNRLKLAIMEFMLFECDINAETLTIKCYLHCIVTFYRNSWNIWLFVCLCWQSHWHWWSEIRAKKVDFLFWKRNGDYIFCGSERIWSCASWRSGGGKYWRLRPALFISSVDTCCNSNFWHWI